MMKKLFLVAFTLYSAHQLNAQSIPNGGFENWSNGDPNNWVSYNSIYTFLGLSAPPVEQLSPAPVGNYAVKMTSLLNASTGETFPGFCYLGDLNPLTGSGSIGIPIASVGIPFNALPPMFTGKFQHHIINPGDTAIIACLFTKWDPTMGAQLEISTATMMSTDEVPNWTDFSVPFVSTGVGEPDSMSVYLFSLGGNGASLSVDQLGFGGAVNVFEASNEIKDLMLFPNPASEEIWVESTFLANEKADVFIYDMTGNVVKEYNWNAGGLRKLDIASLPSGSYVLEIRTSLHSRRKSFIKR